MIVKLFFLSFCHVCTNNFIYAFSYCDYVWFYLILLFCFPFFNYYFYDYFFKRNPPPVFIINLLQYYLLALVVAAFMNFLIYSNFCIRSFASYVCKYVFSNSGYFFFFWIEEVFWIIILHFFFSLYIMYNFPFQ